MKATRRKILSVLLTLAMLCSLTVTTAFATNGTWAGSGSEADPYQIADAADLTALAAGVAGGNNYGGKYFKVTASFTTASGWTGIGNPAFASYSTNSPYVTGGTGFAGTLYCEGTTQTITVNRSGSASGVGGLINYLAPGGKVLNLNVAGTVSATGGVDAVGGVVGYNSGIIDEVNASVTVTANSAYNVGGIAGFNDNYYMTNAVGTIRNSHNNGTVSGSSKVGGIAGENAGLITSCYNTAAISDPNFGKNGVGGIAGRNGNNNTAVETGVIRDCYNIADITCSSGKWVGGICGFLNSKSSCVNCYDTGGMHAVSYTDPISGNTEGTNMNCYYLSDIAGIQGHDHSTMLTASELNGATTVVDKGQYILALLNNGGNSWQQTAGSYPTLAGKYGEVTTPATGVVPAPTPSPETDGIILGGNSAEYADLAPAIAAAAASGKTIYVAGTIDLPSGNYNGGYTLNGTAAKVLIKRSATFTGILFTVNTGAEASLSNMIIDGNSGNGVVGSNLIRTYGGSLSMADTVTLQNSTINANGGAIHVQGGTVASAATISNCSARNGGGAYVSGGSLTLTGGSISGCSNQTVGRAADVYVSTGTTFALNADNLTIDNVIYLESGAYITAAQAIPGNLTVESAVTTNGTVIAQGSGYTLANSDVGHVILVSGDSVTLNSSNQIVIG